MTKIIHYCWFGNNKMPKLALKCIKSWKKYFPDFEIKLWNESNFDINECEFIKQAYEQKKWAFVSDYVRIKVLYEFGGLYLDTDVKVIKDMSELLKHEVFIGVEQSSYIAGGIIWTKDKNSKYIKDILDFYKSVKVFDSSNLFNIAIPKVITKAWDKYTVEKFEGYTLLDKNIYVYEPTYFYPINYDYSVKIFTKNTYAVHYYKADWVSRKEKITVNMYRIFGIKLTKVIFKIFRIFKWILSKLNKLNKYIYIYKVAIKQRNSRINEFRKDLEKYKNSDYVVFHNRHWFGVTSSTTTLFKNCVSITDMYTKKEINEISKIICESNIKLIIFSGLAKGYTECIENIKEYNKDVVIKVLWHGSNALLVEKLDFEQFEKLLNYHNNNLVDEIGFVKKSLYEFFKLKGYRVSFITNYVDLSDFKKPDKIETNKIKLGLYSSLDRWIKNTYNQISAASLFENVNLDITPMGTKSKLFADILQIDITGSEPNNVPREKLLSKMSQNDVNLYVTFTECSPMIPLESLELGVPCITGDNHHYFENTDLEKYLIVSKEDNIIAIYEKIKLAMENKDKILEIYKDLRIKLKSDAKKEVENFLK